MIDFNWKEKYQKAIAAKNKSASIDISKMINMTYYPNSDQM